MKRNDFRKPFQRNPALIDEMIKLRLEGWSYTSLAKKYEVDYSTCIFWCHKRGVPRVQVRIKKPEAEKYKPILILKGMETKLENIEQNIKKEKLNCGKSYFEYLEDEKNRKYNKLLKR